MSQNGGKEIQTLAARQLRKAGAFQSITIIFVCAGQGATRYAGNLLRKFTP